VQQRAVIFSVHASWPAVPSRRCVQSHGACSDGWCWFVLRKKYCWLVAAGWFVLREKYCWLVADKPSEQGDGHLCPPDGKMAIIAQIDTAPVPFAPEEGTK
jgi:hypothetical protein